jgi:tetratricopeptide (TPR) repeat protein
VTHASIEAPFTLKRVQEMLELSAGTVAKLITAGFVTPSRGKRNEHRFSFQDLMLLRTAHALQQARIPPRKILKSLAKLKAELPAELPLTGLRITAVGSDVVVRDRAVQWNPDSGQLVMDFEVASAAGSVSILPAPAPAPTPTPEASATAPDWFRQGEALEATDRAAAEQAYRRAIAHDPSQAEPYLNLGALLCEAGRCGEAVALYGAALASIESIGHEPLVHFNHAIALEDQARPAEALAAYERAIELDAGLADAHYNAGMLLETLGDAKAALRHFSAYRRLKRTGAP